MELLLLERLLELELAARLLLLFLLLLVCCLVVGSSAPLLLSLDELALDDEAELEEDALLELLELLLELGFEDDDEETMEIVLELESAKKLLGLSSLESESESESELSSSSS